MAEPWKVLCGSVGGTSHERRGEPCQDYALGLPVPCGSEATLVAACADGAGSSGHADLGARLGCIRLVHLIAEALEDGLSVAEIDSRRMLDWHDQVRRVLSLEACLRSVPIREFACTLLAAVVSPQCAVFSQIGDGAIVLHEADAYRTVFWPQGGEYANTTFFLTGEDYEERLAFLALHGEVDELALFTDGLQPLALHYATRSVHAPFFDPMFTALRNAPTADVLDAPLRQFLTSRPVGERTDDDKTLILASRRSPNDGHR
jgi:hypothetical protein